MAAYQSRSDDPMTPRDALKLHVASGSSLLVRILKDIDGEREQAGIVAQEFRF